MFRINIIFLLLLFSADSIAQQKKIVVRIIQEESVLLGDFQDVITLKKKPFKFQILLKNVDGVFVFASSRDSVYRFTETGPIRDFKYLPLLQLEEDAFNQNKELNLSETGWSYWFYKPNAEWHPFARKIFKLDSNTIVCTKSIKQLNDISEQKAIRIRDLSAPLYLLFVGVDEYDVNGNPSKELMRRKLKIVWSNEE
jgi:hypothetical protein